MASLAAAALDAEDDQQQQQQRRQARRTGGTRKKKQQPQAQEANGEEQGEGEGEEQQHNGEERGSSGGAKRTKVSAASAEKAMLLMQNVRRKLALLDFEQKFPDSEEGRTVNVEDISNIYFVVPAQNASVQFQHFVALVGWLAKQAGHPLSLDQFGDPTSCVNDIMLALQKMNFQPDFAPMKLRSAYGEAVCKVLDFLCDQALNTQNFTFDAPIYPTEDHYEDAVAADGAEIEMDDVEDEAKEDDDDEDVLYADLVQQEHSIEDHTEDEETSQSQREVLQSSIDPVAWKTEVERVAPRLKIKPTFSGKEWRSHLEQTKKHQEMLERFVPDTRVSLEKISSEIGDILERVQNKEKYINSTFQNLVKEYKELQEQFNSLTSTYQGKSEEVNQLTNELANIHDQIDELASQMEDRGSSMTDTSPLVKIKAALSKLRSEINSMDIRIGVLGHTLMQSKLKKSNSLSSKNKEGISDDMELSDDEEPVEEDRKSP